MAEESSFFISEDMDSVDMKEGCKESKDESFNDSLPEISPQKPARDEIKR